MKALKLLALFILLSSGMAGSAWAQSTWNAGTGFWNVAGNWSPSGVPASNTSLIFNGTGSTITITDNNPTNNQAYGTLTFNNAGSFIINPSGSTSNEIRTGNIADNSTSTETINVKEDLTATRNITVTSGGDLIFGAQVVATGAFGINANGAGTLTLSNSVGNTYSGNTAVTGGGMVLITNTSGSATGVAALSVARGSALAGTGTSSGSSFAIGGTSGSGTASIYVGQTAATGDTNTTNNLTLVGSGASTIANVNLTFNLDTTSPGGSPGLGNELLVGSTAITFGSGTAGSNPVTLTLNLQGGQNITNVPYFVLIAGTVGTPFTSQYSGLSLGTSFSADGGTLTPILNSNVGGSGNLILALNLNGSTFYGGQGGLYLFQTSGGIDDIVVIPEPGTWALMLGGLAVLVFWQRRKSRT